MAALPSSSRRASNRLAYVPALDGLRAVAVLAVLAYHADLGVAGGGFLGVSVFFTLSGFLITTLLLTEHARTGRIELRRFWLRRARRLMPAAVLTIVAVAIAAAWLGTSSQQAGIRPDGLAALGNVANWRFVMSGDSYADLFAAPSPLQHFWSLSIEEQFYVVFPLGVVAVLAATRGRRSALGLALAAVAAASVLAMVLRDAGVDADRLYYGTDTRAFELLAGAGLALWLTRRPFTAAGSIRHRERRLVGFAGLVALGIMVGIFATAELHATWLYDGGLAVFAVLSVLVVRAALDPGTTVARVLSLEPLRLLGVVSYGVYLIHWPVFLWLDAARTGLDGWALFGVQVAVTLLLAWVSYRLVETPMRAGRLPAVSRPVRWWAAPAGAVVAVGVVVVTTVGAPAPTIAFDRDVSADAAIADLRVATPEARHDAPRVLVVGDSVARSLGDGLEAWGESTGSIEVANFGVPACAVVEGGEAVLADDRTTTECGDWAASRADGLRIFEPDVVVMLTGPWDIVDRRLPGWDSFRQLGDELFDAWLIGSYTAVAEELSGQGARVVWLTAPCAADIPGPLHETGAFDTDRLMYLNREILPRVAAAVPAMTVVDLFARVCPGGEARDEVEGVPGGRHDGVHFSPDGAYALSEWLGPQLAALAN